MTQPTHVFRDISLFGLAIIPEAQMVDPNARVFCAHVRPNEPNMAGVVLSVEAADAVNRAMDAACAALPAGKAVLGSTFDVKTGTWSFPTS